jgi:1-acyl-sn-glycerol-3-phosphate acyltransferase
MQRPDLVNSSKDQLSRVEWLQLAAISRSFQDGLFADAVQYLQLKFGTRWIRLATNHLHRVHHIDRLPHFKATDSFILASNHRSFFDLYVVTPALLKYGIRQRMVFPVRSNFFYDHPLGFFVNGVMSFFAMYPPFFRDRKRTNLNILGLDELIWLLKKGGYFVGFHPEGTRNEGDPYELLPARAGVGKLARHTGVPVVPVFTNGLLPDNLKEQILSNFNGKGEAIHTVFGHPIDFGELMLEEPSQGLYKKIANKIRDAIMDLGQEEKQIRAQCDAQLGPGAR